MLDNKEKIFQQNLNEKAPNPGTVFFVHLLFEEKCEMPQQSVMNEIMKKHLGKVDCFSYSKTSVSFIPKNYIAHFKDADINPQLIITECIKIKEPILNELELSQLWDCPDGTEILEKCKYQVMGMDMLAAAMDYKERANMSVEFIEALAEMFPTCRAFIAGNSNKMLSRKSIVTCDIPKEQRFINYAVNVRFFNIQGTDDMIVDSVGMSTVWLPDVQYHFNTLNPDSVVYHAYNVLSYIYDNECPIKSGDHIDGLENDNMSINVQWNVQYEESLIQPAREVLDVNTGEYAAGNRE
ncbi:DUF4261 domain-containing protein [Ruminococcus sp.]|uniref:DUF4261 domain-containing protein n=1 Tax=Ruminococcus sp. TaxID=41978 RepID=UPI00386720C5